MKKMNSLSPCIKLCEIDKSTGLCKGCLRTLKEISEWIYLSQSEKEKIFVQLEARERKQKYSS